MKEKKSQYSIWAPMIRKKIADEKIKKEENGERLTKDERKKIIKVEKRKYRRRATWIAITAALGITAGAKGVKLLDAPKENNIKVEEQQNNNNNNNKKRNEFYEKNKVEVRSNIQPQKEKNEVKNILAEYDYNIKRRYAIFFHKGSLSGRPRPRSFLVQSGGARPCFCPCFPQDRQGHLP